MRTRPVDRARYPVFLRRAEEFLAAADASLGRHHLSAATSNAVHAVIAAMDAMTVFYEGRRSAAGRHEDAVDLVARLSVPDAEFRKHRRQFERLLGVKSRAEYTEDAISRGEAQGAVRSAQRLVAWVTSHLPATGG